MTVIHILHRHGVIHGGTAMLWEGAKGCRMNKIIVNPALARNHTLANTYQIRRTLSVSELSIVYVARHIEQGTLHVIKEFFPSALVQRKRDRRNIDCHEPGLGSKYREMLETFRSEAEILSQIDHQGIVRYVQYFEENGTAYLVTEYCKGMTLDQFIEEHPTEITNDFLLERLGLVIRALEYIHSLGYIHRDIRPSNILIGEDGQTKLLDFGSAVRYQEKTHTILTTAGYSPIEFYSGRSVQGPVSDIYSLAATMYFCCQGKAPIDVPKRLFHDTLEPLRDMTKVSPILTRVIHWGLAVSADKRCASLKWFKVAMRAERLWERKFILINGKKKLVNDPKSTIKK